MTVAPALFSSGKDDWNTPQCVIDRVLRIGEIGTDPCSNATSIVPARIKWTEADDGLSKPWDGLAYVNPPYSRGQQHRWFVHCMTYGLESPWGAILLVPARTDTKTWQMYAPTAAAICYWRGRIRFLGAPANAPFPSALLYWGPRVLTFCTAFADAGFVQMRGERGR